MKSRRRLFKVLSAILYNRIWDVVYKDVAFLTRGASANMDNRNVIIDVILWLGYMTVCGL